MIGLSMDNSNHNLYAHWLFESEQEEIRRELKLIFRQNPLSLRKMADQIGISPTTLHAFLRRGSAVDSVRLAKIVEFILLHKKRTGESIKQEVDKNQEN